MSYEARDVRVTYCVVEAFNCWFGFARSLYISSAMGARDGVGRRVRLTNVGRPRTTDDALAHAIRRRGHANPRRPGPPWRFNEEPAWASASVLLDVLDEVGSSNRPDVTRGLGLPTSVLAHLPTFRHFFAHRGGDTIRLARAIALPYGISPVLAPTQILLSHASTVSGRRPQPLLLDWIDDLLGIIALAI
jgi:hypothetical protein